MKKDPKSIQLISRTGTSEADVRKLFLRSMKPLNCHWIRIETAGVSEGVGDLYGISEGVSVWVEIKAFNGRIRAAQHRFMSLIMRSGGRCFVVQGGLNKAYVWAGSYNSETAQQYWLPNDASRLLQDLIWKNL